MEGIAYYVIVITSLILVAGSVIAVIALRNAPEGFESEEGFVGLTKGDEQLLHEFATFREQSRAAGVGPSQLHA